MNKYQDHNNMNTSQVHGSINNDTFSTNLMATGETESPLRHQFYGEAES